MIVYNLAVSFSQIERYVDAETSTRMLPMIGRARRRRATDGLHPHHHTGVWEICLLTEGEVTWFQGPTAHTLVAGSVLVTPPDVEHGTAVGGFEPSDLAWLQIDPAAFEPCAALEVCRRNQKFMWVDARFERLVGLHEAIMDECREPADDSASIIAGLLAVLVGYVTRGAREPNDASAAAPPDLQRLLNHIDANLDRRVNLAELTKLAGVSRTQLHALFREHLGQSPGAVVLQRRLQRAQELLHNPRLSVSHIAIAMGFASSQHFATAFRGRFGVSPSAYRKQLG